MAGAAALLRQQRPGLSSSDTYAALNCSATPGLIRGIPAGTPNLLLYDAAPAGLQGGASSLAPMDTVPERLNVARL